jgi:hypothetical protein
LLLYHPVADQIAWIRVIFCSGPRQVVNALTLWSVFEAKLSSDENDVGSSIVQFFKNIAILAEEDHQQAVVLSGMVFTLIIWVFAALSLLLAVLFYIFFLWHYIPNHDGGLSGYCERKINSRLTKIVSVKVNKAIADEERRKQKAIQKAAKKGEKPGAIGREATLPTLFNSTDDDKFSGMPPLDRHDTMATLPVYDSRPNTPGGYQPSLPDVELTSLDQKRPYPSRSATESSAFSNASYSSKTPLIGGASDMGYGRAGSPAPSLPPLETNGFAPPRRTNTGESNGSNWSRGTPQPGRMYGDGPMGPPRNLTGTPAMQSPTQYDGPNGQTPVFSPVSERRGTPGMNGSVGGYGRPIMSEFNGRSTPASSMGRRTPFAPGSEVGRASPAPGSIMGRNSPAPFQEFNRGTPAPSSVMGRNSPAPFQEFNRGTPAPSARVNSPMNPNAAERSYTPFNPAMRSASTTPAPSSNVGYQPYRNFTEPVPERQDSEDYFNAGGRQTPVVRSGTPQALADIYGSSTEVEAGRAPSRAANNSPAPGFQAYRPDNYRH